MSWWERIVFAMVFSLGPCSMASQAEEAVAAGHADAAVYDVPMLRYLVAKRQDMGLHVLARKFERQDYSIALPEALYGSPSTRCFFG